MKNADKNKRPYKKLYNKLNREKKRAKRAAEMAAATAQEAVHLVDNGNPQSPTNSTEVRISADPIKRSRKSPVQIPRSSGQDGDESNESYSAQRNGVLPSLARDTKALEDAFNSLEGLTCQKAQDGMYLFPHIQFPQRAIMAAEAAKTAPDAYYTKRLLEATGIIAVPGSDYGQVPGTWYIGLSILLQEEKLPVIITRLTGSTAPSWLSSMVDDYKQMITFPVIAVLMTMLVLKVELKHTDSRGFVF